MKKNRRKKVAVILKLWQNYDRGMLQGIAAYIRERRDWSVFVEETVRERIPSLDDWEGDGMIVNFDNRQGAKLGRGFTGPVVGVGGGGGWWEEGSGIPYVATDDLTIGRMAAEHLMERGLQHFAFCGYPPARTREWVDNRARGFTERLAQDGFECGVFKSRRSSVGQWEHLQAALVAWLGKLSVPVGLMGCYDYRARHVLEACKTVGLRVPDDVAVIGVDNDFVCEFADPPLSSVEQGRFNIGYTAASVLDGMMNGREPRQLRHVIPPVGVVGRQSTDLLCVADEDVVAALRLIREGACRGLQVDSIAAQLHLSRSTLDKRFKSMIGRPVDAEIRRVRMARAQELLARTELPLRDVAREAGYSNEQYLSAVISKEFGCSPAQYRRDHRDRSAGSV